MSSSISFYMYFTQVLCFTFPFLAIPWCPLFPLLRHTHTQTANHLIPTVLRQPCPSCHPLLTKLGTTTPARYCTASCTGCTGISAKSNVNDGNWWDFLSDLWSCACTEKDTIPNTAVVQEADARIRGYSLCSWKLCTSMWGKKRKKTTKIIFFMTVQYSKQFYKLPRILLPGITKCCGIHLRFAVLGIIYTIHENTHFSPKNKWESPYK